MNDILTDALRDYDDDRLTELMVSPFADRTTIRPVRIRVFAKVDNETIVFAECVGADASEEEKTESIKALDRTIASLPPGEPLPNEILAKVIFSDINTVVMLALFKNEIGAWVRLLMHHPSLTKEHAFHVARSPVAPATVVFLRSS